MLSYLPKEQHEKRGSYRIKVFTYRFQKIKNIIYTYKKKNLTHTHIFINYYKYDWPLH